MTAFTRTASPSDDWDDVRSCSSVTTIERPSRRRAKETAATGASAAAVAVLPEILGTTGE